MAGRPRKQFERISEINTQAAKLYRDLDLLTPDMHKERAGSGDRLGIAWLTALEAAGEAWRTIHHLSAVLALRAGMGVLPDLETIAEDIGHDESMNPTPDDATEDSAIVVDCDVATLETWSERYETPIPLILERVRAGWDWECAIILPENVPTDQRTLTESIDAEAP
jgi:hypothetical protein